MPAESVSLSLNQSVEAYLTYHSRFDVSAIQNVSIATAITTTTTAHDSHITLRTSATGLYCVLRITNLQQRIRAAVTRSLVKPKYLRALRNAMRSFKLSMIYAKDRFRLTGIIRTYEFSKRLSHNLRFLFRSAVDNTT